MTTIDPKTGVPPCGVCRERPADYLRVWPSSRAIAGRCADCAADEVLDAFEHLFQATGFLVEIAAHVGSWGDYQIVEYEPEYVPLAPPPEPVVRAPAVVRAVPATVDAPPAPPMPAPSPTVAYRPPPGTRLVTIKSGLLWHLVDGEGYDPRTRCGHSGPFPSSTEEARPQEVCPKCRKK